jgi:hypothetical protein
MEIVTQNVLLMPPGERIKKLIRAIEAYCAKHEIPKAHFARLLGIERQQLNDYLTDRKEPSGEMVLEIQELLKRKPRKAPKDKRRK